MVNNVWERSKATHPDQMVNLWKNFFVDVVLPAYHNWLSMPTWRHQAFLATRDLHISARPNYYQLKNQLLKLKRLKLP
jgi:hypothetical protein